MPSRVGGVLSLFIFRDFICAPLGTMSCVFPTFNARVISTQKLVRSRVQRLLNVFIKMTAKFSLSFYLIKGTNAHIVQQRKILTNYIFDSYSN